MLMSQNQSYEGFPFGYPKRMREDDGVFRIETTKRHCVYPSSDQWMEATTPYGIENSQLFANCASRKRSLPFEECQMKRLRIETEVLDPEFTPAPQENQLVKYIPPVSHSPRAGMPQLALERGVVCYPLIQTNIQKDIPTPPDPRTLQMVPWSGQYQQMVPYSKEYANYILSSSINPEESEDDQGTIVTESMELL